MNKGAKGFFMQKCFAWLWLESYRHMTIAEKVFDITGTGNWSLSEKNEKKTQFRLKDFSVGLNPTI